MECTLIGLEELLLEVDFMFKNLNLREQEDKYYLHFVYSSDNIFKLMDFNLQGSKYNIALGNNGDYKLPLSTNSTLAIHKSDPVKEPVSLKKIRRQISFYHRKATKNQVGFHGVALFNDSGFVIASYDMKLK
jgi:hypothetical protein